LNEWAGLRSSRLFEEFFVKFKVEPHGNFYRIIEIVGESWPNKIVLIVKKKSIANKIADFLNKSLPQGSA
jgi:hypothetical protein